MERQVISVNNLLKTSLDSKENLQTQRVDCTIFRPFKCSPNSSPTCKVVCGWTSYDNPCGSHHEQTSTSVRTGGPGRSSDAMRPVCLFVVRISPQRVTVRIALERT